MSKIERLGVIGDIHAEDERLKITLDFLCEQKLDAIVCTGDIVDGTGCPDRAVELLQEHEVFTVRGNHDRWILQDKARHVPDAHARSLLTSNSISYLSNLPIQIELDTTAGKLLLCHGIGEYDMQKIWPGTHRLPMEKSKQLDEIIALDTYRFLINGHMHFRTIIYFTSLTLINAGTLKRTHRPGFSIIDFADFKVTAFEYQENTVEFSKSLPLGPETDQMVWQNTDAFTGHWTPLILYGDLDLQE